MDTRKTGNFLRELRREHGMTQEQLGERIGVTNKTVSRWETGTYMPPIECLRELGDIYSVSINEILAGERLEGEQYREAADSNISEVMESSDRFERIMTGFHIAASVLAAAVILLLPEVTTAADRIKEIIIIVLVVAMAFIANTLSILAIVLKKDKRG